MVARTIYRSDVLLAGRGHGLVNSNDPDVLSCNSRAGRRNLSRLQSAVFGVAWFEDSPMGVPAHGSEDHRGGVVSLVGCNGLGESGALPMLFRPVGNAVLAHGHDDNGIHARNVGAVHLTNGHNQFLVVVWEHIGMGALEKVFVLEPYMYGFVNSVLILEHAPLR